MTESFQLKNASKVFGDEVNMRLVTTNEMYRRTIKYQRDMTKLSLIDAKQQQAITKYYRDITRMQEEIDRLSALDSTGEDTNKQIANLMEAINSKPDPTLDEDYILRSYDVAIDRFEKNLEYLNDVLKDVLSDVQLKELNNASGTPIQKLAEEVTNRVLNVPDDPDNEVTDEEVSEEEGLKD